MNNEDQDGSTMDQSQEVNTSSNISKSETPVASHNENASKLKSEPTTPSNINDNSSNITSTNDESTTKSSNEDSKTSIANDGKPSGAAEIIKDNPNDTQSKSSNDNEASNKESGVPEDDVMDSLDFEEISDEELEEETKVKGKNNFYACY